MSARLILHLDDDRVAFPLEEGENVIGRKKACEIYVRDGSLSKFHARILRQGERLEVVDAGSRNGTLINGDAITPEDGPVPVIDGDEIQCGKLTFLVEGAGGHAASDEPPAAPPYLVDIEDSSRRWELEGTQALGIGSRSQNHVRLEGNGISRFHAELSPEDGEWVVKDLGSRNGVFVNEEKVDVHVLTPGDVVKIGPCSLRYVVPSTPALSAVLADPRKRLYIIGGGILAILLLAMTAFSPPEGGPEANSETNFQARFEAACAKLMEGDHDEAQESFKRLKEDRPDPKLRSWVRAFDQVSRSLEDYDDPLAFDWDNAEKTLSGADRLSGLPDNLEKWVEDRVAWVESGKKAYALLQEGTHLGNQSVEAARKRKFRDSFELQRQAREYLGQVTGPLAPIAERRIAEAWIPVLKSTVGMIQRFMRPKSKPPHWKRAQELIDTLLPLTLKIKERNNLRRYSAVCSSNMEDEELYRAAIGIVERGEVEFHSQAIDFLRKINRQSSIYRDAQAILAWLEADGLVRNADKAFQDGRGDAAIRMLHEARDQYDTYLGEDARESIDRRILLINKIMRRWQRQKEVGTRAAALRPLEEIVALLEDSPRNFYRIEAQRQFDHVRAELTREVGKNLRKGLAALTEAFRGGFQGRVAAEQAMELFERVRSDPNHKREHIIRIKGAVAKSEDASRVLYGLERKRKRNQIDEDMVPPLKLLKTWLPPGAKQAEASELYKLITERLRKQNQFKPKLVPNPPPARQKKQGPGKKK